MYEFSVITSIYKNDRADYVRLSLDSMLIKQTVKPSEIVIIQDGPVSTELSNLLQEYEKNFSNIVRVIRLEINQGLGNALKIGVEETKFEYVARMDSDDICVSNRFELQIDYLMHNPQCDIVGGQMTEFIHSPDNVIGRREVPLDNASIYQYMKSRCALNHVTVMFKRSSILKVGNYQDWFWNEDYYLWVRMMLANCQFANIPQVLVNVRSGADQYARRGGRKYFNSEIGIKKLEMLDNNLISRSEFYMNYMQRFVIQLCLPNCIRGWVFRTFARKK